VTHLDEVLKEKFGLPVEPLNPFRSIFTDDRAVDAAWLTEHLPRSPSPSPRREADRRSRRRHDPNQPSRRSQAVKKKRGVAALGSGGRLNTVLIGAALGVAVLAGIIHYFILSTGIKSQEEKIRVAQVEVTRLETVLKEVRDFEQKKTASRRRST